MGQLMGYARVSTVDQDASLQVDALEAIGCHRVFVEQMSGLSRDLTGELLGLGQLHDEAVQYLHVRGRLVTRTSAGAGGGSRSPAGAHTVAAVRLGQ